MDTRANAFLRRQQQRWLRPDAARWVRPDAAKFLKAGTRLADVYPALELKYPGQPRVPAGSGDPSGEFASGASSSGQPRVYIITNPDSDEVGDGGSDVSLPGSSLDVGDLFSDIEWSDLFDINPRARRNGGVRLAGDLPDGFRAPDDKPPKVPKAKPGKSSQRTAIYRAITGFARRYPTIAADIVVGIINNIEWLEAIEDMLHADLDPPKTLQELQAGLGERRSGYDVHHIIEQTAAERWGLTRSQIDDPSNLVSIPRLKHYQITGWYGERNTNFGGLSPREYLNDKEPSEQRRIGLDALILFKVLKP